MMMDQVPTLRFVVAVLVCCALLSFNDVTTLPLPACSSLVDHVESLIDAGRPLPADDLRLYLACLGVERQHDDDDDSAVRQLLALHPRTDAGNEVEAARGGWSTAEHVCSTVECLARQAALTFEPCSRLTQAQCSALVYVLEHIIISTNSDDDDNASAERLREQFLQFVAHYQKLRESRMNADRPRTKRRADGVHDTDRETGNDSDNGMTSSRITSGMGDPRTRRSTVRREIPFRLPENMTPETRAVIESYREWRAENGYGRLGGRWG